MFDRTSEWGNKTARQLSDKTEANCLHCNKQLFNNNNKISESVKKDL